MIIQKDHNDPNGYAFEDALAKAQYMYPKPRNPHIHTILQHAQQIYLNSLATHGQARPNSSHKYGVNASNAPRPSHNQLVNHREANSKSALATVGKH